MQTGPIVTAIVVAASFFYPNQDAESQILPGGGADCGAYTTVGCPEGQHNVQGASNVKWKHEPDECWACGQSDCHPACTPDDDDPETVATYTRLVDAANSGDVAMLVRLATKAPAYVNVNMDRRAVQLKSCDRSAVIASISVSDGRVLAALVARLQSAGVVRLAAAQANRAAEAARLRAIRGGL